MRAALIVVTLAIASCERKQPEPLAPTVAATPDAALPAPRVDEPPPTIAPQSPDFEDIPGTVRQRDTLWVVEIEGEDVPLCLPFESPAEARVDGAQVRFTLYLSEAEPRGCRTVETLISMRVVD